MLADRRVVLLANTSWYLANFRFDLANALRDQGAEVHCIAPPGKYLDWLAEQGFVTHVLDLHEDSFGLAGNRGALAQLKSLYREIQPALAHHFTPRCVVLGSMAASNTGVPRVINALTGLGHVFTTNSLKARLARPVLRMVLKKQLNAPGRAVIFQNADDMAELIDNGVVNASICHLVRGSGVNTARFQPSSVPREDDEIRVFFASRLIAEKGVHELLKAMSVVIAQIPSARLWIAGEPYAQNPTSLTESDLRELESLPWVKTFGHIDDVDRLLAQVDIVALPSYREGTPKILLEAAACGLPIVATDIAGCRGVVEPDVNGYLVPVKDTEQLAESIGRLCGDKSLRQEMGMRGRDIMMRGFSTEIVVERTLGVYAGLL